MLHRLVLVLPLATQVEGFVDDVLGRSAERIDAIQENKMYKALTDMVSTSGSQSGWQFLVFVGILHVPFFMMSLMRLHGGDVWGDGDVELMRHALFDGGIV